MRAFIVAIIIVSQIGGLAAAFIATGLGAHAASFGEWLGALAIFMMGIFLFTGSTVALFLP